MANEQTLDRDTTAVQWRLVPEDRARTERAHATRVALLRAQYETARAAYLSAAAEFDD